MSLFVLRFYLVIYIVLRITTENIERLPIHPNNTNFDIIYLHSTT